MSSNIDLILLQDINFTQEIEEAERNYGVSRATFCKYRQHLKLVKRFFSIKAQIGFSLLKITNTPHLQFKKLQKFNLSIISIAIYGIFIFNKILL